MSSIVLMSTRACLGASFSSNVLSKRLAFFSSCATGTAVDSVVLPTSSTTGVVVGWSDMLAGTKRVTPFRNRTFNFFRNGLSRPSGLAGLLVGAVGTAGPPVVEHLLTGHSNRLPSFRAERSNSSDQISERDYALAMCASEPFWPLASRASSRARHRGEYFLTDHRRPAISAGSGLGLPLRQREPDSHLARNPLAGSRALGRARHGAFESMERGRGSISQFQQILAGYNRMRCG